MRTNSGRTKKQGTREKTRNRLKWLFIILGLFLIDGLIALIIASALADIETNFTIFVVWYVTFLLLIGAGIFLTLGIMLWKGRL